LLGEAVWTHEFEIIDIANLSQVDSNARGVEPLRTQVATNHVDRLWLSADTVSRVRVDLRNLLDQLVVGGGHCGDRLPLNA
jgi:hypothetical protein